MEESTVLPGHSTRINLFPLAPAPVPQVRLSLGQAVNVHFWLLGDTTSVLIYLTLHQCALLWKKMEQWELVFSLGIISPCVQCHRKWLMAYQFYFVFIFKVLFIYFREGKGEGKRGGETSMSGWFLCVLYWGPGPQPRDVPWLGIEPASVWFTGRDSIHWATPARAIIVLLL